MSTKDHDPPPAPRAFQRADLFKAAVLAGFLFLVYGATRTRHFGGDDTVFALVVQRWLEVGSVERAFFHPHHLLYNPVVAACGWLVRILTGSVFVLDVGAAVSAAAAAAAVSGTYLVLRRFRIDDGIALLAAASLAVSGGLWRYATRMEVYSLAAAGVVVWLTAMSDARAAWSKLAAGFAAPWVGHSVLGLLALPGAWLHRRRPRVLAAALIAGLVAPGTSIVFFLASLHGARSASSVGAVFVAPGSGSRLSLPDPAAALRAVGDLVALRTYHALPVFSEGTVTVFDLLGLLATAILAALVVWGAVASFRDRHRLGMTASLGVFILMPLWLVWDVGNHEHAVAASPLFAALAAFGAVAAGRRLGRFALAAVAAALLIVNGVGSVMLETQSHLSRTLLVADLVRKTVAEEGALVAIGVDPELRLSLPHLGGRRVIDLTALAHSARRAGASPDDALERWLHVASAAPGSWLLEDPDSPAVRRCITELGISDRRWREAREAMRLGRGVTLAADDVVVRDPITLRRLEITGR